MEETYQLIEGSPTLRDLDAENGFLWCPFGHSGRQNEPGILISRLDDGSYDVRLGTGFDSPERFATGDPDWSWMDLSVASTVDATFADDMALSDWIASETTATGAAWARCFNPGCGPDGETCDAKEITAALKRFESPSYIARGAIEQIVAQLIDDGDDFPVLFDGERVIEAFDGSPVHMSVPVEVDGEKVWTCGYDFCWGETVAPDFSRARGRFPDATVAAWAAERSVNGSDVNLGIKERML